MEDKHSIEKTASVVTQEEAEEPFVNEGSVSSMKEIEKSLAGVRVSKKKKVKSKESFVKYRVLILAIVLGLILSLTLSLGGVFGAEHMMAKRAGKAPLDKSSPPKPVTPAKKPDGLPPKKPDGPPVKTPDGPPVKTPDGPPAKPPASVQKS